MNTNELKEFAGQPQPSPTNATETAASPPTQDPIQSGTGDEVRPPAPSFVNRKDLDKKAGLDRQKLLLLGGGLLAAILFFVLTALLGKPSNRPHGSHGAHSPQQVAAKDSVTPLTEADRKPTADDTAGQLSPNDISRTRNPNGGPPPKPLPGKLANQSQANGSSLASVPSFADTQQRWEEPRPYGATSDSVQAQTQQQNVLKEPSLIFVKSQTSATAGVVKETLSDTASPSLDVNPGTRIQAKLETQISSAVSAPVVAVIEYTYAIGDQVVIPAGARVYGTLRQAGRSGLVDVRFSEIELLDGAREKIDAIGAGLDLGPIKGSVSGKNTGRNFLVRAASGLGSVAAMIVGNNTSAAFSEDDLLRERVAENIGTAGDTELMNLNTNSRIVVSVPADTKIYVVFTEHEQSPATTRKSQTVNQ